MVFVYLPLFNIAMNKPVDSAKMHSAGATVTHNIPFGEIKSLQNDFELTEEFINKWVAPFYMEIGNTDDTWIDKLITIKHEITEDVISKCLGDFNWRTRQVGAYFACITDSTEFIDIIGIHLLKSEVSYAGRVYCHALAFFNTSKCIDYLNQYLDYYLKKPDLWFDQADAMEAILYIDKINDTDYFNNHINNWLKFIENKPYWDSSVSTGNIDKQITVIKAVINEA